MRPGAGVSSLSLVALLSTIQNFFPVHQVATAAQGGRVVRAEHAFAVG